MPGGAGSPSRVRPSHVRRKVEPWRFQLLMMWFPPSRTRRFQFIVAEAGAFQVTEPRPVMKLEGDCFGLNILGRPSL